MSKDKPSSKETENKSKKLEQEIALIQSNRQDNSTDHFFQAVLDLFSDAFVFLEGDGTIISANAIYESITGYRKQELIGKKASTFIHADCREDLIKYYKQLEKTGSARVETKNLHKDGRSIWVEVNSVLMTMQQRTIVFSTVRDISARKLAEAESAEQNDFLKKLTNSMPGILYVFDRKYNIIHWNKNFEQATGFSGEELKSKHVIDFFLDEDLETVKEGIAEAFRTNLATREASLTSKDGNSTHYFLTGTKVTLKNMDCIIGLGIDLADRIKLEAQLRQSQKMEVVGQLAGGVAHDFNNMLNVILGYAEIVMLDMSFENPLYSKMEQIKKAAKRSANITKQLLGFSRKQVIDPKPVDINNLVVDIEKMISRLIGEDIDLILDLQKKIWTVKLDSSQIDQLVINLALNARDAMPNGGKVIIGTQNVTFNDDYCSEHAGFIPGEFVMTSVSDNGTGMNKKTQEHIFEPFYTTKELGKGTGMGLATVYGITKQNNGFINVYSEPGKGTTFKLYLPRWIEDQVKSVETTGIRYTTKPATILLVEDDEILLEVAEIFLKTGGHEVISFSSPNDALEYCEKENSEIHILLTDVVMPEMNGKILSEKIKKIRSDIKVIFMSGYTANMIAHHGILDKNINFINKPFSMNELLGKIQEAIEL